LVPRTTAAAPGPWWRGQRRVLLAQPPHGRKATISTQPVPVVRAAFEQSGGPRCRMLTGAGLEWDVGEHAATGDGDGSHRSARRWRWPSSQAESSAAAGPPSALRASPARRAP